MSLQNKIDIAIIISVKNANPNGDPLNGNRPRTDYDGFGEITDVCLKRKLRDRLQDAGHAIFVQSDERKTDSMPSLRGQSGYVCRWVTSLLKQAYNPYYKRAAAFFHRTVLNDTFLPSTNHFSFNTQPLSITRHTIHDKK